MHRRTLFAAIGAAVLSIALWPMQLTAEPAKPKRKAPADMTDDELQREWDAAMWWNSQEGLSKEDADYVIEIEREIDRRPSWSFE